MEKVKEAKIKETHKEKKEFVRSICDWQPAVHGRLRKVFG